jgi:Family of unknown function (DUF5677)
MKETAQNEIVNMFARTNHLDTKNIPTKVKSVIAHAAAPMFLFKECLEFSDVSNSTNPIDGLLITMATRMYKVVSGTLSLLALGQLQQAEILSRTVMESSLSLLYIAEKDTGIRILQYFEDYIKQEREQNRKWKNELVALPDDWKFDNDIRINKKNEALDNTALFLEHFAKSIGVKYPSEKGYLKFIDICAVLNKSIDYRTVYMAMCSQAHHDAEDILNDLMVGTSPNEIEMSIMLERETNNFSIFLVLHGIRYYLECLEKIGAKYSFISVEQQASKSNTVISNLLADVCSGGFIANTTDEWMPNELKY